MGDTIAPGIRVSAEATPRGLVLLVIDVDGAAPLRVPVDPLYVVQLGIDLVRTGQTACAAATTKDAIYNDLRMAAEPDIFE